MIIDSPLHIDEFNYFFKIVLPSKSIDLYTDNIRPISLKIRNLHLLLRLLCGMLPAYSTEEILKGYNALDLDNLHRSLISHLPIQTRFKYNDELIEKLNEEFDMITTSREGTPSRIYAPICETYMTHLCVKILGKITIESQMNKKM